VSFTVSGTASDSECLTLGAAGRWYRVVTLPSTLVFQASLQERWKPFTKSLVVP